MNVTKIEQVRVPSEFATDVRVTLRVSESEIRSAAPNYSITERIGEAAHRAAWQLTGLDRVDRGRRLDHVRR